MPIELCAIAMLNTLSSTAAAGCPAWLALLLLLRELDVIRVRMKFFLLVQNCQQAANLLQMSGRSPANACDMLEGCGVR